MPITAPRRSAHDACRANIFLHIHDRAKKNLFPVMKITNRPSLFFSRFEKYLQAFQVITSWKKRCVEFQILLTHYPPPKEGKIRKFEEKERNKFVFLSPYFISWRFISIIWFYTWYRYNHKYNSTQINKKKGGGEAVSVNLSEGGLQIKCKWICLEYQSQISIQNKTNKISKTALLLLNSAKLWSVTP